VNHVEYCTKKQSFIWCFGKLRAMDISLLVDQLNDGQRNAVAASSPHQLVLAGAGSGKTWVLVHRIAWLPKPHLEK